LHSPKTITVPTHWPAESGWANRRQERRMEMNWRVVITVANSSAPNVLMVWLMKSWPTVAAADSIRMEARASGWRLTKLRAGWAVQERPAQA
jgi:hypothetical protein